MKTGWIAGDACVAPTGEASIIRIPARRTGEASIIRNPAKNIRPGVQARQASSEIRPKISVQAYRRGKHHQKSGQKYPSRRRGEASIVRNPAKNIRPGVQARQASSEIRPKISVHAYGRGKHRQKSGQKYPSRRMGEASIVRNPAKCIRPGVWARQASSEIRPNVSVQAYRRGKHHQKSGQKYPSRRRGEASIVRNPAKNICPGVWARQASSKIRPNVSVQAYGRGKHHQKSG